MKVLQKGKTGLHLYSHRPSNNCLVFISLLSQDSVHVERRMLTKCFTFHVEGREPVSELTYLCPGSIAAELFDLGRVPQPLRAAMSSAVP